MEYSRMPDKEWKMHRILAQQIFKFYDKWYFAYGKDKDKAKEQLLSSLALRQRYPHSPRA